MLRDEATSVGPRARTPDLQLLCVDVAGRRFGLPVEVVLEIHAAVQIAPLPAAPDVVAGLVNRRGQPFAVLDLRRRIGLPSAPLRADHRLVAVRLPERDVALLVDAAVDILTVRVDEVDEAVATTGDAARAQGVAVLRDGLLAVLDVSAFLSPTEATALDDALQQVSAQPEPG